MSNPYNDPIIIDWNRDENFNKISIEQVNEEHTIFERKITLNQIPDPFYGVQINGMNELKGINKKQIIETIDQFKVDYSVGLVTFHPDLEANDITVNQYYGRGVIYYPASRIYTKTQDGNVIETLGQIIQNQARNFIFSEEEPPEDASDYTEGTVWFVYEDI